MNQKSKTLVPNLIEVHFFPKVQPFLIYLLI